MTQEHNHDEVCAEQYLEWKQSHKIVVDMRGTYARQEILAARAARDALEQVMKIRGCSGEAIRKIEKEQEIAKHGYPLL
tara:strand:- start:99 stop:335 length:237 start_codon:yes stop_codon:yes gene_type:complete